MLRGVLMAPRVFLARNKEDTVPSKNAASGDEAANFTGTCRTLYHVRLSRL